MTNSEFPERYVPENVQMPIEEPYEPIPSGKEMFSDELILRMVSGTDILDELKHTLKGEFYNVDTSQWERDPDADPLMNDLGIKAVMKVLNQYINRNTVMSNIDEEWISDIMEEINIELNGEFFVNLKKYGVKKEDFALTVITICTSIYFALRRAKDSTTLRFLKSTERHVYSYASQGQEKKRGGILGKLGI